MNMMVWYVVMVSSIGLGIKAQEEKLTVGARYEDALTIPFILTTDSEHLRTVVSIIKKDLEFTQQIKVVSHERLTMMKSQAEMQKYAQDYPFIVFFEYGKEGTQEFIEWRLYDADQALMLSGKRSLYNKDSYDIWAHHIADQIWPVVMGYPGFFSSKIAYCKSYIYKGRPCSCICIRYAADVSGETEKKVIDNHTLHMALRWNRDEKNPLLLFSEWTKSNIRLAITTLDGNKRIVSNFDGINMQASYAPDEQHVVVCLMRNGCSDLYRFRFDEKRGKGIFEQLTPTDGFYFDPWWANNGLIYFSSDALNPGFPSVGQLDPVTKKITWLTTEGYCTNPVFCEKTGMLAYLKRINGIMQVMLYDPVTKTHTQLTFDATAKNSCAWSPCGHYLAIEIERALQKGICICNAATGTLYELIAPSVNAYSPAWGF